MFFSLNQLSLVGMMAGFALNAAINAVLTAKLYELNVGLTISSFVIKTAAFLLAIFPFLFFLLK